MTREEYLRITRAGYLPVAAPGLRRWMHPNRPATRHRTDQLLEHLDNSQGPVGVVCDYCHAQPSEQCRSRSGRTYVNADSHVARYAKWARQWQAGLNLQQIRQTS